MAYKNESRTRAVRLGSSTPFCINSFLFRATMVLMISLLCAIAIWPLQFSAFNHEGGLIETISAGALLSAGLTALVRFPGITRLYIGLVCLLLAERELEAEVFSPDSVAYMILNGLDMLLDTTMVRVALVAIVAGGVIWHGIPSAWRAFRVRAPFLLIFVMAGFAAVVAQLLEEISGFFGASLSHLMIARLFVLEETLEMYFSIGILAAVLIGWPKPRSEETQNEQQSQPDPDAR